MNENTELELTSTLPTEEFMATAIKRAEMFTRLKEYALSSTNQQDWIDQGGKPYLQATGAEKVARLFGISWTRLGDPQKIYSKDDAGDFYYFQTTLKLSTKNGDEIEVIGTCSSRDQFFTHAGKLKLSELSETNLLKKSQTNAIVNGITRILGIRNLTWDEVEKFAKFHRNKVAGVSYNNSKSDASGFLKITGSIENIEYKPGKTKKDDGNFKEWILTRVFVNGISYGTFSDTVSQNAASLFDIGLPVVLTYKQTPRGNFLENIEAVHQQEQIEATQPAALGL